MRSRTTFWLQSVFQAAVTACRDNPDTIPPPPPPTVTITTPPPPSATEIAASTPTTSETATAAPTATSSVLETTSPPATLRYGQLCPGTIALGLKPAKPVDYLELRLEYFQPAHEIVHAGSTGVACSQATDVKRCKDQLTIAKSAGAKGEWLVYTRGDEVGAVGGNDIPAFLAPVDSPEDAAAVLLYVMATTTGGVLPTCDPKAYKPVAGGYELVNAVSGMCDEKTTTTYRITRAGVGTVIKTDHKPPTQPCQRPFLGRRPEGLCEEPSDARRTDLGAYFAENTWFEAASVHAFARLEQELAKNGAPRTLRRRAARARKDEMRHARTMRRLARRHGGAPPRVRVRAVAPRDLEAMAIENAVEGCVHETYAALVATWQATHAQAPAIRKVMEGIARDETRHAALAWDVAAWLDARLSPESRERVNAARAAAVVALAAQAATRHGRALIEEAGLPTPEVATRLVLHLQANTGDR